MIELKLMWVSLIVVVALSTIGRPAIAASPVSPVSQAAIITSTYTTQAAPSFSVNQVQRQPQEGGIIESIIKYFINATVYFPAKTFEQAVSKALTQIFLLQFDEMRQPLEKVLDIYGFKGSAIWGDREVDINGIGHVLTDVAVPVWMLSLVLIGLSVLARHAAGAGYGLSDLAHELLHWFFIALASGNGITIVNLAHKAFNALSISIVQGASATSSHDFVRVFMPERGMAEQLPLFLLVTGAILGFVVILVMCVTYIARITLLFAVAGLAPLSIAAEGVPFTRFVFRDWLSMFLRLELLGVLNAIILVLYKVLGHAPIAISARL